MRKRGLVDWDFLNKSIAKVTKHLLLSEKNWIAFEWIWLVSPGKNKKIQDASVDEELDEQVELEDGDPEADQRMTGGVRAPKRLGGTRAH